MLLVPTEVRISNIEGVGCFATADIPKGTLVWRFEPTFDIALSSEEYDNLPAAAKAYLERYGYETGFLPGKIILDADNARFFNHSRTPTIGGKDDTPYDVALRDIREGEELTEDYRTYPDQSPQSWL